jgi:hypothetical protein
VLFKQGRHFKSSRRVCYTFGVSSSPEITLDQKLMKVCLDVLISIRKFPKITLYNLHLFAIGTLLKAGVENFLLETGGIQEILGQ